MMSLFCSIHFAKVNRPSCYDLWQSWILHCYFTRRSLDAIL